MKTAGWLAFGLSSIELYLRCFFLIYQSMPSFYFLLMMFLPNLWMLCFCQLQIVLHSFSRCCVVDEEFHPLCFTFKIKICRLLDMLTSMTLQAWFLWVFLLIPRIQMAARVGMEKFNWDGNLVFFLQGFTSYLSVK